jgi:Cu-Zn family superoxide dismutase
VVCIFLQINSVQRKQIDPRFKLVNIVNNAECIAARNIGGIEMRLPLIVLGTLLILIEMVPFVSKSAASQGLPLKAEAKLESKSNSKVSGKIDFEQSADGMKVAYSIEGLVPSTKHGIHVHEKGDCSSMDAKSAGKHFAMIAKDNGTSKDFPDQYAGDFPEIQANEKGKAVGSFLMPRLSFQGQYSISEKAVIVHAAPDDMAKPSAPRVACGVISLIK